MRAYCGFSQLRLRDQGGTAVANDNGILVDFGSGSEPTPPAGSDANSYWDSGTANAAIRIPFHDGSVIATPKNPAGTNYILQFRLKLTDATGSPFTKIGVAPRSATDPIFAIGTDANAAELNLQINNVVVATAAIAFGLNTWRLVTLHRNGNDYDLYLDGDLQNPIITYASGGSNPTGTIQAFHMESANFFVYRVCDLLFAEFGDGLFPENLDDAIQASVGVLEFDGDGFHADWTGATPIASITRSGSTATVTQTAHGYTTGDDITITGATQAEYNGTFSITVTGANTYTYTVAGTPVTPATGTPVAAGMFREVAPRPADDAYFNAAGAVNERQTYTVAAPAAAAVYGITAYLRVTRHGTAAGGQVEIMSRKNSTDRDYGIKSAPGDGFVIVELGGTDAETNAWDVSDLGEFGFVSRT